jgi:hypothetical protein
MLRNITGDNAAAGGVADMDDVVEVQMLDDRGAEGVPSLGRCGL